MKMSSIESTERAYALFSQMSELDRNNILNASYKSSSALKRGEIKFMPIDKYIETGEWKKWI